MMGTLRGGLLLAILAMAAGEIAAPGEVRADCDANTQGCGVDERRDVLQGLDLLQMKVNLVMDQAEALSAASHADAQPAVQQTQAFPAKQAIRETEVHTLHSRVLLNASPSERESSLSRARRLSSLAASAVSRSLREAVGSMSVNASKMFGLGGLFILVLLCVCLVHSRRSHSPSQEIDRMPSDKGSPYLPQMFQTRSAQPPNMEKEDRSGSELYRSGAGGGDSFRRNSGNTMVASGGMQTMGASGSMLMNGTTSFVAQSPHFSNSSMSPAPSPANDGVMPTILPPICPSLILPHTEARFMIPIDCLMKAAGELDLHKEQLDIRGTSGRKLLHGAVSETPEGRRCLALASCGCDEDPRVTLLAPPRDDSPQRGISGGLCGTMELYGKNGKFYGTLEPAANAGALLRHNGEFVMSLEMATSDLRMTASSMDGRLLASAGKNVTQSDMRRLESNDMWKVQVKPNFDAVLIASCMLGALLFK